MRRYHRETIPMPYLAAYPYRSQVTEDDICVELGCSYGETTKLLIRTCPKVVAVDISPECIRLCRDAMPGARFELVDCLRVR